MPRYMSLSVSKESGLKLTREYFRTSLRLTTAKSNLTDLRIVQEVLSRLPLVRGLSSSFDALAGTVILTLWILDAYRVIRISRY